MASEIKKDFHSNVIDGTSSDIIFDKQNQPSIETKVGQIEIKIESLSEKVSNSDATRKWVLIAIIAVITFTSGFGFFIGNLIINYNERIFNLQQNSYNQIVQTRKEFEDLYNIERFNKTQEKLKIQDDINNCLKFKKYWEYQSCFHN